MHSMTASLSGQATSNAMYGGRKRPFWAALERSVQIAMCIDIMFFFLFHFVGSPILAWVNVVSVTMYACAYFLLQQRRNRLAVMLIWTEVICHAALGTVLIGWDSGFHYYLLIFVPALFVSSTIERATKAVAVLWFIYVGFDFAMQSVAPLAALKHEVLLVVRYFNISVVFSMLAYLSYFYIRAATEAEKRLQKLAATDPLTGLANRRHLLEMADYEARRGSRDQALLSFVLIDIDHFKSINDQHGHDAGDSVLVAIADTLRSTVREKDMVARWGGEEFLVMLPDTTLSDALALAERIRCAVEGLHPRVGAQALSTSVTLGVSTLAKGDMISSAISHADKALYRGKASGRNRVLA